MSRMMGTPQTMFLAMILALAVLTLGVPALPAAAQDAAPEADLSFGTDLDRVERTLIGEGTVFAGADFAGEEGRVYCLSRIRNLAPPASVTHVWYRDGKTMARVELNVGSTDWRTWSSKRILPAWTGDWEVKVLDADGMVLASAGFKVE